MQTWSLRVIMLKISVPFKTREEVIPLIEAGADELYCGYLSPEWEKKFTTLEFERKGGSSNFMDIKELKGAVSVAHKKDTPVYLTLNGLYVKSQYPLLFKIVQEMEKIDFDAYIVADLGLLLTLRELKTKKRIHISTGGTAFNSEAVDFYRKLGASRIVLDRQTKIEEMGMISRDCSDIEFEVFILNTLCVYTDGFCTFLHCYALDLKGQITQKGWRDDEKLNVLFTYDPWAEADACCLKYSCGVFDSSLKRRLKDKKIRPTFYKQLNDGIECGACAIYDISTTQVKAVKIVGRQLTPEIRLESTKFIRSVLDILKKNRDINRWDFIERVQGLYQKTYKYKSRCRGNNCYHPEVILESYGDSLKK